MDESPSGCIHSWPHFSPPQPVSSSDKNHMVLLSQVLTSSPPQLLGVPHIDWCPVYMVSTIATIATWISSRIIITTGDHWPVWRVALGALCRTWEE